MANKIIRYRAKLKPLAQGLRQQGILAEVLLWQQIQKGALGVEFHRQVPIDKYIADFYCHELKLIIEVDGSTHNTQQAATADNIRQQKLESFGIEVIRFSDDEVLHNMMRVLMTLQDEIDRLKRSKR